MTETIRVVEYFYAMVPDRPGEAARMLKALKDAGVNLLAFSGFPEGRRSQLDFIPSDAAAFKQAARQAKWKTVGPRKGFLVQGDDRVGAIADILYRLARRESTSRPLMPLPLTTDTARFSGWRRKTSRRPRACWAPRKSSVLDSSRLTQAGRDRHGRKTGLGHDAIDLGAPDTPQIDGPLSQPPPCPAWWACGWRTERPQALNGLFALSDEPPDARRSTRAPALRVDFSGRACHRDVRR